MLFIKQLGRVLFAQAVMAALVATVVTAALFAAFVASNASAATAETPLPVCGLGFEFTSVPAPSSIWANNVVSFTLKVDNPCAQAHDGSLIFPSWVRLGAKSNQHLVWGKLGQLTWNFGPIAPRASRTLTVPIVVTTAWGYSSCDPGQWHFGAQLFDPVAANPNVKQELCYSFSQN